MTSVETQTTPNHEKTRYIKALPYSNCSAYSGLIIFDLDFLKNCPLLEGALIFKKLFGLVESDDVFCYDLKINKNLETTILQDFRITKDDWKNFIFFLHQGSIPEASLPAEYIVNENKRTSTGTMDRILHKLESVMGTCITFGGVPKFEEYYKNYFNKLNTILISKNYVEYNPGKPTEDNLNRYMWASHNAGSIVYIDFINLHKVSDGWSAASSMSSNFVWYKKLKNGNESDIDAVYTESEIGDDTEQIVDDTDSDMSELESDSEMNDSNVDSNVNTNIIQEWLQ